MAQTNAMFVKTIPEILAKALAERTKRTLENHITDPLFRDYLFSKTENLPSVVKTLTEWSCYLISGAVHSLGEDRTPINQYLAELSADFFSGVGKRVADGSDIPETMRAYHAATPKEKEEILKQTKLLLASRLESEIKTEKRLMIKIDEGLSHFVNTASNRMNKYSERMRQTRGRS
jgi:hypothetical protein